MDPIYTYGNFILQKLVKFCLPRQFDVLYNPTGVPIPGIDQWNLQVHDRKGVELFPQASFKNKHLRVDTGEEYLKVEPLSEEDAENRSDSMEEMSKQLSLQM
ncbi:hypothetical protein FISHEDRAFT_62900 [Fistulina hepatica ATCC 64428]|uniref:Uncharacterized protein n=1 Tax=Fistulina hepatica ATCC 64428 TaxID=1128425 RepID=A0A0D6ZZ72_9AGAR|nr:hypothetical protein FISHEDRAFT_62900 [Fistulina hepatica ATCC 64428]